MSEEIRVGSLWINEASRFRLDNYPFGGVGRSGFGREGLPYAIDEYTKTKFTGIRIPANTTSLAIRTRSCLPSELHRCYISDPPAIAIPSSRQNSRPDISETEWRTLYTYLRKYVKEAQDKRRHRERFYLQHYILILANSGIRVGEARHLRWRDISSTKTLSGQKRLIFTVRGKTGEREVVCNDG
jgi:integrase